MNAAEIQQRIDTAQDAVIEYGIEATVALTATACGLDAVADWDRTQTLYERAVTAVRATHPLVLAADAGAETMTDYCQENHMPIAPPRPEQWFRVWAADYSSVIWDLRTSDPISSVMDAAKQFMTDHQLDDVPLTVDWGTDWKQRWSGRISIGADGEHTYHQNVEYLRCLTNWPNPAFDAGEANRG